MSSKTQEDSVNPSDDQTMQAGPTGRPSRQRRWRRNAAALTAGVAAVATSLVALPALTAGAAPPSTGIHAITTNVGTAPSVGHPQPAATAKVAVTASAVDPTTGDVVEMAGNQVFLLVNQPSEPATDYGIATSGTLTQGDVYLIAGRGSPGWTPTTDNAATAAAPYPAATTVIGKPQAVTFDAAGNVLIGSSVTGESNVIAVPRVTGSAYGFSAMAGYPYFIAGYTATTPLAAPAIDLPSAVTFVSLTATSGLVTGSVQDVAFSTQAAIDVLNFGSAAKSFYGTSVAAGHVGPVANGTGTCSPGAQSVAASAFPVTGPVLDADSHGNLYIANQGLTACAWVLPKATGTLVVDGASTPVTAGQAYKIAGNGTSPRVSPPVSGASAVSTPVGTAYGITLDQAGNPVILINGSSQSKTTINGAWVVANSSETFYGQTMAAGDLYPIAGGPGHLLQTFKSPNTIGADNTGDLYLVYSTGSATHILYEVTGGPVGLPTVATVSPKAGPTTGNTAVTIGGTGFFGTPTVKFGGTAATDVQVVNGTTITAKTPTGTAGTVTVSVKTTNGTATLVDGFTYVLPPAVTSLSATSGPITGGTAVTVTGTGFAGTSTVDFGTVPATVVSHTSGTELKVTAPAATAVGQVDVLVTTGGLSSSASAGDKFTYDPTVTGLRPTSGSTAGGTPVTVTGAGFAGTSTVKFGTATATVTARTGTTLTVTTPAAGSAGPVNVTVTTDGVTSVTTATYTYVAPPAVTSLSATSGPITGGTAVTVTGTGFAGTSTVKFGTVSATVTAHTSATQLKVTAPAGAAVGQVDVLVITAGLSSSASAGDKFTYDPTVTGLSPTSGSTVGGFTVTVTGAGFAGTSTVKFGTATATVTARTSTTLTVTVPAGSPGPVNVTATTDGVTSVTTATFTYILAPTVSSLSATSGPVAGGTPVTITGTGFAGTSTVKFGTTTATVTSHTSATELKVTAPAGSAGQVDVLVTTDGVSSSASAGDKFTYAPTVTNVSPTEGSTLGGATVTITGTGFTGTSTVKFGTASATVTAHTGTTLTVTTPTAGSGGPVNVTVTTNGATSTTVATFTYIARPTVTSVAPTGGQYSGGVTVTITGTNLTRASAVSFGTLAASSYTVTSATTIKAVDPATTAGPVSVSVTTPGGTAQLATGFTYAATAPTQPAGSTAWTTGSSTSHSGTATASATGVKASGAGAGAVGVGLYTSNPTTGAVSGGTGVYYDVAVGPGSDFSSVTITACSLGGGNALDWWNGTTWSSFSSQSFSSATGCVTATVNGTTSPTLAQLTGTPIAVVKVTTTPPPAPVPAAKGYYEVASDGGIFAFGTAPFYGSMGGKPLNAPVVGLATNPNGKGYWEVASDGGIFAFGTAPFYGSMGGQHLNAPIVAIAVTPTGGGYWEVASDGGIFSFGTAVFDGSMGGQHLNKPIVGLAVTPTGGGYWEVASDGGIFSFGAPFYGSTGNLVLNKPVVGIAGIGST